MAAVGRVVALAWLVSLPILTARRAPVFRSDVTLWTDAALGSQKPRPWLNLASALLQAQEGPSARMALQQGTALIPGRSTTEARVAYVFGQVLEAQAAMQEGQWATARQLATNLQMVAGDWPPARVLCRQVTC